MNLFKKLRFLNKKNLALVLLFFLAPALLYGQEEPKTQNYPFFWRIERDGKTSYILATQHERVSFNDLLYHEEIKSYLRSADILLKEISPKNIKTEPRLLTKKTKALLNELEEMITNKMGTDYASQNLNSSQIIKLISINHSSTNHVEQKQKLSRQEMGFLINLWREDYLKKHGDYPKKENLYQFLLLQPYQMMELLESFIKKKDLQSYDMLFSITTIKLIILEIYKKIKNLDQEIENYFLKYKKAQPMTSSQMELLIKKLKQFYNDRLMNISNPSEPVNYNELISSLDDIKTIHLTEQAGFTLIEIEDIKDWIQNYSKRFSKKGKIEYLNYHLSSNKEVKRDFLSGELDYDDHIKKLFNKEKGVLDSEIRYDQKSTKWSLDFRNQLWLPQIIEAHQKYRTVFIIAGVAHFIRQERNPLNIPEFTEYTEQNKDLPTNILDMLKNEGFKITRFGEGDFTSSLSPCQKAFL